MMELGTPNRYTDVAEECGGLCRLEFCDGFGLDPFGEFVNDNDQVGEAPGRFFKGSTKSNTQTANGQVTGMVWRAWAGICVCHR